MKKVTYRDLYDFNFLSDVSYSPDGKHAIFARQKACPKKNGYKSYVWMLDVETGEASALTYGGDEKGAKWLDNDTIVFTSGRNKAKDAKTPSTDYFKLSIREGGEASPFFSIPERAISMEDLGDGKFLLAIIKHCEGKEERPDDEAMDGRDLLVFDEVYFWFNGQGIRNKLRNSLIVYDAQKKKYKQVTGQYFNLAAFAVSPDRQKIAFTGASYTDKVVNKTGLYVYDCASGKTHTLVRQGQSVVGAIAWNGDGELFAAINDFAWSGRNSRFHVFDVRTGKRRDLPFIDAEIGGTSGTDVNYGGGQNKKARDGKLYMTRAVWGDSHLCVMDLATGEDRTLCGRPGSVNSFDLAGGRAFAVAMRGTDLNEIYSIDLETGEETRLTAFNQAYADSHEIAEPEHFTFTNRDGVELDGYLLYPVGYLKGHK